MVRNFFWKIKLPLAAVVFAVGVLGVFYTVHADPNIFRVSSSIQDDNDIGSGQAIVINFSDAVIPTTVLKDISIFPKETVEYIWENDNKRLVIKPSSYWKLEQKYRIKTSNGKSSLLFPVDFDFSFVTTNYPKIKNFYPLDGEKAVAVDMQNPIRATFDKSLEDFMVRFEVDPMEKLTYQLSSDKKAISLISKEDFKQGKKYSIAVLVKHKKESDSVYRKIYTTSFETVFPLAPEKWDIDPKIKLEQAKFYTRPQFQEGKYIDINLKQQVMVIFENGKPLDAFLVSSGKPGMETPVGLHQIKNKSPRVWSKKYSLFMPFWMAMVPSGEFGIHELPEWPSGYKEGANHLGRPVSHGCVRLGVGAAEKVYNWAEIGTPVAVHK